MKVVRLRLVDVRIDRHADSRAGQGVPRSGRRDDDHARVPQT
jgi:hypothetical protein